MLRLSDSGVRRKAEHFRGLHALQDKVHEKGLVRRQKAGKTLERNLKATDIVVPHRRVAHGLGIRDIRTGRDRDMQWPLLPGEGQKQLGPIDQDAPRTWRSPVHVDLDDTVLLDFPRNLLVDTIASWLLREKLDEVIVYGTLMAIRYPENHIRQP